MCYHDADSSPVTNGGGCFTTEYSQSGSLETLSLFQGLGPPTRLSFPLALGPRGTLLCVDALHTVANVQKAQSFGQWQEEKKMR